MTSTYELWLDTEAPGAADDWWAGLSDSERVDIFRGTTDGQTAYSEWVADQQADARERHRAVG